MLPSSSRVSSYNSIDPNTGSLYSWWTLRYQATQDCYTSVLHSISTPQYTFLLIHMLEQYYKPPTPAQRYATSVSALTAAERGDYCW